MLEYPLTVVEAPMGYGKTTAVREFLAAKGCPVLWLTFLSSEDTAVYFWDRLSAQIGKLDRTTGDRLKSLGFPADAPQTANILSILNGLDFEPDTVLVIDDYHFVRDFQIGRLLSRIVAEQPENLHIAVITRDTSNLEIGELLARGQCNMLPQQTLTFTDEEVRGYCALMGFAPAEDELRKILEYTGGWIALVYLVLLGMAQGIPVGRNSIVDELVEKVLYNACDARIRQFLLNLSVMDNFTAKQARYVTQEVKAEELLKRLRRENAFVAFDEAAGVYTVHGVLLDFLRAKLEDGARRAALNLRAGEWHLAQKAYALAYQYLYRSGETERILALLDNEDTMTKDSAEFEGVLELFAAQPRALLFKYPLAYLQYIILLLLFGGAEAARDGAARLDELERVYREMEGLRPKRKNRILAEINVVRIFAAFNDVQAMTFHTGEALRLLEGAQSCLVRRKGEFTFAIPHFLYSYYRQPGTLRQTAEALAADFEAFSTVADGCGAGCGYTALAEYALETGDWQAAELNAFKAICKAGTKEQTGLAICASLTLIRLYLFQGKIAEALGLMRQLREDVARENNALYITTLELVEGYVNGCLGRRDDIPLWLQKGDMSPARFMYRGLAFNYIVYGKALLLSRNDVGLEVMAGEFERHFSVYHNQLGFLHNRILEAAAKYRLYGMEAGCAALRKALDMAREDGIILPFAEYAPAIIDMLRHVARFDARDGYAKEVLRACERYMESLKRVPQSAAALSAREIEVLRLAAEGMKRGGIAARLGVSESTVHTHLHNIYLKLEVNGKTEAIKKAQKLKIF
ncbi:MAG TPA: LuxR C-terminal-related transcriptional regulator [Clostridia bacterium]|nr:LuxR C-terminal-related transcriptional regulator [Clostridia bacterium]